VNQITEKKDEVAVRMLLRLNLKSRNKLKYKGDSVLDESWSRFLVMVLVFIN